MGRGIPALDSVPLRQAGTHPARGSPSIARLGPGNGGGPDVRPPDAHQRAREHPGRGGPHGGQLGGARPRAAVAAVGSGARRRDARLLLKEARKVRTLRTGVRGPARSTADERSSTMAQTFEKIPDELIPWIEAQPVFFVATAPADQATHINVSPRGLDTFRVLDANRVAWLDLTGSGVETIAHLRADGRITLMFCAFDDPPRIVRLYDRGAVHEPKDEAHDALRSHLPDLPGARAIIDVAVDRVSSSCGFGVPLMDLVGPREQLVESARRKGEAKMAAYRARKNAGSIDGLPGLQPILVPEVGGHGRSAA